MAAIGLERVGKKYPNGHMALQQIDLEIADGEFLVLVGPSGCGKSTLLRLVAGLETPSGGTIRLDGADITGATPQARDLAMVFQSYALYPHMTVRQNLAYGLRVRRTDAQTIARRLAAVTEALGLDGLLDRRPAQLSGGQRQRVALGRAMVREPKAFLFDEPLSNLDPALRLQARTELLRLQRRLRATVFYVTHDQEEAMTLGTRVAVMREGRIEQVGTPEEVYGRPASRWVAEFLGEADVLPGTVSDGWVECELARVPAEGVSAGEAEVLVRPESVALSLGPAAGGRTQIEGVVVEREFFGHDQLVHVELPSGRRLRSRSLSYPVWHPGDRVRVRLDGPVNVFTAAAR